MSENTDMREVNKTREGHERSRQDQGGRDMRELDKADEGKGKTMTWAQVQNMSLRMNINSESRILQTERTDQQ